MRRPASGLLGPNLRNAGLTLLEVIVALVLLSMSGVAIIAWMNQNLATAGKLQAHAAEARLQQNAMGLLSGVDPAVSGAMEFESIKIQWNSSPVKARLPNRNFDGVSAGGWQVGVFVLQVQATDTSTGAQTSFEVLRTVSRRV